MGGVLLLILVTVGCLLLVGLLLLIVRLRGSEKSEQDVTILRLAVAAAFRIGERMQRETAGRV
ncbi:hypothetical protein [Mycetocola miduiensis]|uniref:Uncharacterized protein n=1 Tax=Mycetocola miduiensis TaxID=995034 RepID=A0A1I5B9Z9_9MICO|nr:hypothetical protein [Mycetocola miduiensis]SFN71554.1 hypothetical protein SAMN05216219_1839 [Mycetocola miduiensis]